MDLKFQLNGRSILQREINSMKASIQLHKRKISKFSKKIIDLLSRANDTDFLRMTWSVNILQSRSNVSIIPYLNFPKQAKTDKIDDPNFVYKWEIETLILLLLSNEKHIIHPGPNLILNCGSFSAMREAVNLLRALDNSEGVVISGKENLLSELHRIAQRQFPWQRGFASAERLYRYSYIYGQGKCAEFFHEKNGISISDFIHTSFLFYAYMQLAQWQKIPQFEKFGIGDELLHKTLNLLALNLEEMRNLTKQLIMDAASQPHVRAAYLPSSLREFPIIRSNDDRRIISPLPDLIIFRATVGLYYDICQGRQDLLNEANKRFEEYTIKLIGSFYPELILISSKKYGPKKYNYETPDAIMLDEYKTMIVIECKATKLTYKAQFAQDPINEADGAYAQIAKGVAQLWRFFSHMRRGLYRENLECQKKYAMVLTMDSWMQASPELQEEVINRAKKIVELDTEIIEEDKCPIIFCSMQDLVDVMMLSSKADFLKIVKNAALPKYARWGLRSVMESEGTNQCAREFPLSITELLPWWNHYTKNGTAHEE